MSTNRKVTMKFWNPLCAIMVTPSTMAWQSSQLSGQISNRSFRLFSSDLDFDGNAFRRGSKVQVEVVSFGPLGASVNVIGMGHDSALLDEGEDPYGVGLIYQKEIAYFRSARNNVDVVRGEILPAYIQKVRDDGKLDIGLRAFGGKAKSDEISDVIMDRLESSPDGILNVGDKSSPEEIEEEFPGVSKTSFKKAVGALFKKGLIQPSAKSISIKND